MRYGPPPPPTDIIGSPSDSSCIPGGDEFSGRQGACDGGSGWGIALREEGGEDISECRLLRLVRAAGGGGGRARREAERPRVQETGSPGWATKRVGAIGDEDAGTEEGPGALEATRAEANAVARSASENSEMETVREREGPAPRRSCGKLVLLLLLVMMLLGPSPLLSATALRGRPSSMPSMLMLFLRPRCRSRSMLRHISSVTPKRSRQRRSWRARESGRVSGLWQMAHGEGWPPWRAVLLRWRERSRGVPNWRLHSVHLYLASVSVSCTIIRRVCFDERTGRGMGCWGGGGGGGEESR